MALICAYVMTVSPAHADENEKAPSWKLYEQGGLKIDLTLTAGFSLQSVRNANFGVGSVSLISGERRGGRSWTEGFLKPLVGVEYDAGDSGTIYGGLSFVGAATRGQGEAQATSGTTNQPSHVALEDAFLGWKSGNMFPLWGNDAIDVSGGYQSFTVGDGFLVTDGTVDGVGRAAYYLGPRSAFENTLVFKLNTDPVRADFFHLKNRTNQSLLRRQDGAETSLYGVNVEWFESDHDDHGRTEFEARKWYVGLTALHVYNADSNASLNFSFRNGGNGSALTANREGLNVYSVRLGGAFIGALPDFKLHGEAAIERNNRTDRRVSANAYHGEPSYTFSNLLFKPRVSYRYSHFSGDGAPGDRTDKSWDPLFSNTGPRGIGTWSQGEIYSQYVGTNSNLNAHQIHLRVTPIDGVLNVGVLLYRLNYDRPSQTDNVSADRIMDEIDVYAEWTTPIKNLNILGVLAAGRPGNGVKQSIGSNDANSRDIYLGEMIAAYRF
ncbi:MAG: alginate export family protein [Rhodospirillales bacterium]|nr:alginate export family protein [Rhodospirillales bacterium]